MKKLINDPADVVPEMLEGLVALHPGLALLDGENVVVRADAAPGRPGRADLRRRRRARAGPCGLCRPRHAERGGRRATSSPRPAPTPCSPPSAPSAGPAGVLLIVKNYTGDRLNFGLAAEIARAEGIPVEMVIVADDVALPRPATHRRPARDRGHRAGPQDRGRGGRGRAAARGGEARGRGGGRRARHDGRRPLALHRAGRRRAGLHAGPDEIELGLGIHGEPGVRRTRSSRPTRWSTELADPISPIAASRAASASRCW